MSFIPAWWLPGPHLPTLWGKFFRRFPPLPTRVERWDTPDDDFVDVVRLDAAAGAPRLFILHGLEGTARSHYARALMHEAHRRGWGAELLLFRGCGPELNRTRRFYHSGETEDARFALARIAAAHPTSPLVAAGVSLGGNVLLKLLGEWGDEPPAYLRAAAAVSVPFDLARSSRHVDRGFARVYQWHFLRTLRRKARAKQTRIPDLLAAGAIDRADTIWAFDDHVTAPLHGYRDAVDYYERASALGWLRGVRVPTLLLSSFDDPFLPPTVLDEVRAIAARNPALHLELVPRGGHAGFVAGPTPWRARYYMEGRVADHLQRYLEPGTGNPAPGAD
ncbi:MAG TPA: hydrolase [Gemmatimonadaceae bacterium]|nr:hydrolase [Gemmatimonadaceae bacterium]